MIITNTNFGITETYPNKLYYNRDFLLVPIPISNKRVEFNRIDTASAIREEVSRRFKRPPLKVIYVLPYFSQKEFAAQFILVNGFNGAITGSYPVDSVEGIERLLQDKSSPISKYDENWIEIYTTRDPIDVKEEQYKGRPLMDIMKSIVGYSDDDEKRYLQKVLTDFVERRWKLKGMGMLK